MLPVNISGTESHFQAVGAGKKIPLPNRSMAPTLPTLEDALSLPKRESCLELEPGPERRGIQ